MPWGDSSDQDRSRNNYEMLSAMPGTDVMYTERAEYCLGGIGIAFLERGGDIQTKPSVFRNACVCACVFTRVHEH